MTNALTLETQTQEYGLLLHEQCLSGSPAAFERLANDMFSALVRAVKVKSPKHYDEDHYSIAVAEAIMTYKRRPQQYDSTKGISLFAYLRMSAIGDFKNLVESDKRRHGKNSSLDGVEQFDDDGEQAADGIQIAVYDDDIITIIDEEVFWERISLLLPDERDQRCLYYMMQNVRETETYSQIYALALLPLKEQEHEVKKQKDRIKKRLQRRLDRKDFDPHD